MLEVGQRVKVTGVFDGEDAAFGDCIGMYGRIVAGPTRYMADQDAYLVRFDDDSELFFPVTNVVPRPAHRGVYDPEHWGELDPETYNRPAYLGRHTA